MMEPALVRQMIGAAPLRLRLFLAGSVGLQVLGLVELVQLVGRLV